MKQFLIRTAAMAMGLGCLLLIEAAIIGTLPPLAAVPLVFAALAATGRVFRAGLRPTRRHGGPRRPAPAKPERQAPPAAHTVWRAPGGRHAA